MFLLGVVLGERGDLVAAMEQFRTSTELAPGFAMGHYNLGLCLAKQGNRSAAIEAMGRAAAADPAMEKAKRALAELKEVPSTTGKGGATPSADGPPAR